MQFWVLLVASLAPGGLVFAASQQASPLHHDELDEVVVEGKVPGPPLWKISNGDRVLWILPLVDIYPKRIDWDSSRVERLLAGSQEYLYRPRSGREISSSAISLLTMIRGMSAYKKLTHQPRGTTLSDQLPPDLYRRLLVLKSRYFPRKKISDLTIWEARRVLEAEILEHENLAVLNYSDLTSPLPITTKLLKWLNRNKKEKRTNTSYFEYSELTSQELKKVLKAAGELRVSVEAMQWEVACMENSVTYFERDFGAAKRRANAWAQGHADGLVSPTRLHDKSDSCKDPPLEAVFKGNPKLEQYLKGNPALAPDYADMNSKRRERWLAAAESALTNNTRTFGVLSINDILDEGSLVAELEARGYTVEVSAR